MVLLCDVTDELSSYSIDLRHLESFFYFIHSASQNLGYCHRLHYDALQVIFAANLLRKCSRIDSWVNSRRN
jgi:hypothetical protein